MPAGLRSQTPISQTAAKPNLATASHSTEGTLPKSTEVPVLRLSSESQTHVLISYSVGNRGQLDMHYLFGRQWIWTGRDWGHQGIQLVNPNLHRGVSRSALLTVATIRAYVTWLPRNRSTANTSAT